MPARLCSKGRVVTEKASMRLAVGLARAALVPATVQASGVLLTIVTLGRLSLLPNKQLRMSFLA